MGVNNDSNTLERCAGRLAAACRSTDGSPVEPRLVATADELSRLDHLTQAGNEYRQLLVAVIDGLRGFPDTEALDLYHRVALHVRERCRAGCAC